MRQRNVIKASLAFRHKLRRKARLLTTATYTDTLTMRRTRKGRRNLRAKLHRERKDTLMG